MSNVSEETTPAYKKVSVLVLTYNHERYVAACLQSILENRYPNFHVWILDDGSTDGTRSEIDKIAQADTRVTLLTQPNSGGLTAANTQRLIDESDGEYILFMSGDDMLGPGFPIWRAVQSLNSDSQLGMILPRLIFLMEDAGQVAPHLYKKSFLSLLLEGDPKEILQKHLYKEVSRLFLQGLIVRRDLVRSAGGFDTGLRADDYAFQFRLFQYLASSDLRFRFDSQSLWLYRIHQDNLHLVALRQFRLVLEVVKKYVPRDYWKEFSWDIIAFETLEDLTQVQQDVRNNFPHDQAVQINRRLERASFRAARKSGKIALLRTTITNSEANLRQRVRALLEFAKAHL
jgi:glycosyltransferase involved in cell wall biosynthesis